MRKVILFATLVLSLGLLFPKASYAQTVETCVQTTQYGGGVTVVCGVHTPTETGLAENLIVIGGVSILTSGILHFLSRRIKLNIYNKTGEVRINE
ncbi:hypothetical protein ACFL1Q_01635 [Patescibacteria group bacterium]